jgi:hypothetical protein
VKCLNLIINTSLINQFLTTSSFIFGQLHSSPLIGDYFKFVCFLLVKAHDPCLNWFRKYFGVDQRYQSIPNANLNNSQRQFSFKFDPNFFSFLNDSRAHLAKDPPFVLAYHVYACILNEFSVSSNSSNQASFNSNLNDNLLRAIKPQIIDLIFDFFKQQEEKAESASDFFFLALDKNQSVLLNQDKLNVGEEKFQLLADLDLINRKLFYDRKLLACKCLPLVVNILHLALPDKRLIDMSAVLDKLVNSLDNATDNFVRYELVRCYLSMLDECLDKAAMKIVLVSRRFILCLLEQLRLVCALSEQSNADIAPHFLNEFVYIVMSLLKNLLDQSQSVRDVFSECNGYTLLYEVLKSASGSRALTADLSILMNEMICEKQFSRNRQAVLNLEKNAFSFLDDVRNCEMSVLMIRLVPYMQPVAQEFSLRNICHLCTVNFKNIVKSCQNSILFDLIDLLNYHRQIKSTLIGNYKN